MDVYIVCPVLQSNRFTIRFVNKMDGEDLLKVYADESSVPFFNADNCYGDNFHYTTIERMQEAIDFWLFSYKEKYFVRWSIVNKETDITIGTIELFHRKADDYFNEYGILRMDLKSEYEQADIISEILETIINPAYDMFHCNKIATKAIPKMKERRKALIHLGFQETEEKLIGHDGTEYDNYFVIQSL